jgi:hypothetical protein
VYLEPLEDRTLLSVSLMESFESGNLSAYQTVLRYAPSAQVLPVAAHDGNLGLVKQDGYEWIIRNDGGTQFTPGETLSAWVEFGDVADGRAYLGFDARPNGTFHSPLAQGGTLSLVLAANTNQLILENNSAFNQEGVLPPNVDVGAVSQTFQANHWYRVEVFWGAGGNFTGRLYDSDGTTLLNTVSGHTTPQFTSGGIAFRALGHNKYFDSVVLDSDSTGSLSARANAGGGLAPGWTSGTAPDVPANGAIGGHAFVPWAYTSAPGTGRDVELAAFNQLQQVAIIGNTAGLAAGNVSAAHGTKQIGWGPPVFGGFNSVGTPVETPLLAQYLFRQRPGEPTQLIGSSDVKHFFSSAKADSQHLNPGESDEYTAGLNTTQSLYSPGSEVDPVTGEEHRPNFLGAPNTDGVNVSQTQPPLNSIDRLLQVNVADLDPAQNPVGTRWFLMGNLFVAGDQDVSNNSRWEEIVPSFNGTTFTFNYPNGSTGQVDFRTIPGLVDPGLAVTASSPQTSIEAPVSQVQVSFDRAVDPATFNPGSVVSFTGPSGASIPVTGVTPVTGLHNTSFYVTFPAQTDLGTYTLVLGTGIQDGGHSPLAQPYTAQFTIEGLRVIASTPTGNLAGPVGSVDVTFRRPVDLSTFDASDISLTGPGGAVNVTGVTPVAGSNNTRFHITFAPQNTLGVYTFTVGPNVSDTAGFPMDQVFTGQFTIEGPRIVASTPSGAVLPNAQISSVRVTFNHAINPATFTPAQVVAYHDFSHFISVTRVVPVGTSNTVFDIFFPPQVATGHYTVLIGPNVRDTAGHAMDQNDNFTEGEVPDDMYAVQFDIAGLQVNTATSNSTAAGQDDRIRVAFNEPVDVTSFTPDKVLALTAPDGTSVPVLGVAPVLGTNFTQFDVVFAPQTQAGAYTLTLSQHIRDVFGNEMDQNNNQIPGQDPFDQFTGTFTVTGPRVIASTPSGSTPSAIDHVRVTFNTPMDPSTVTADAITGLTGPAGPIPVSDVTEVPFTNHTQFDVHFATQTTFGAYSLVFGTGIQDAYGNPADGSSTASFTIVPTYAAAATTFQNLELAGQPGTQAVTFSGSGTSFADDDYGSIDLGNNTFNFYGTTYTGAASLFVSSNALITFGTGNTAFSNTNLNGSPPQAAIAPLWSDWIKSDDGTGPMILYQIVGNQLIIEWNKIQHFSSSLPVTFQAILTLNTGTNPGDITFNYVNLNTGNGNAEGRTATVGVRNTDNSRLLVSFNSSNTLVGTGKAIHIFAGPPTTQPPDVNPTPVGAGPRVTAATVNATSPGQPYSLRVTFNEPIDVSSFTPGQVAAFTGPGGVALSVLAVAPVPGTNYTQFDVLFAPLTRAGSYAMVIGPHVRDVFGREMDQNNNGTPGETPQDQFTATFAVAAPQIVSSSPTGNTPAPVDHVRLTFNSPMNGSTFGPGNITSFTGPNGAIAVSGVSEVPYTNHTQFDVTFAPQTALGSYSLVVGPNIQDVYGNATTASFTAPFTIAAVSLVANGGFETGDTTGWTRSGDTSADSVITSSDPTQVHGGTHSYRAGPNSLVFLTQTLATTPGARYTLDFWLSNPVGGTGTEWLVRVGGTTLMDVHDAPRFNYTHFTFTFTATSSSTSLQFGFAHPPDWFYLDDVSVTPT